MDFHSTKYENSIPKYFRVLEALVALFLVSTRLPAAAKLVGDVAGKSLSHLHSYLYNPLVVFFVFNAIIAALVLLSRKNHSEDSVFGGEDPKFSVFTGSDPKVSVFTDLDPKVSVFTDSDTKVSNFTDSDPKLSVINDFDPKLSVLTHFNSRSPVLTPAVEVLDKVEEAKRQVQRYERTQSVNSKRELRRAASRHQLRRSETDIDKSKAERVVSETNMVDKLSNEEFQRTIEEFIAKQQRFLWAQKMAEREMSEIE